MRAVTHLLSVLATVVSAHRADDRGASLVEYALLLALIAMVCIAAVTALGGTTSGSFSEVTSMLS